jgi:putative endonuclease
MVKETSSKRDGGPAAHLQAGERAEDKALQHLLRHGLTLVARNYRVAHGPSARAGEIDLIMREADGTLVFVEVRSRATPGHGGAAASVSLSKQRSIIRAAQHFLMTWPRLPPCRFDVVALDDEALTWLRGAFDAGR